MEIHKRFQARYLQKWTAAIEGIERTVVREWSHGLAGMTPEQIKRGLDEWCGEWPPTLPEFIAACRGKKLGPNEFGLDYVPEVYRRQPEVQQERLLSSNERDARRAAAFVRIAEMKAALGRKHTAKEEEKENVGT